MPTQEKTSKVKILLLAANPEGTSRSKLDEEVRAIEQALREAELRDYFDLHSHWAVRVDDVQSYFLRYEPDIVHFSGNGSKEGKLYFATDSGHTEGVKEKGETNSNLKSLDDSALARLFSIFKQHVKCVVLTHLTRFLNMISVFKGINFTIFGHP